MKYITHILSIFSGYYIYFLFRYQALNPTHFSKRAMSRILGHTWTKTMRDGDLSSGQYWGNLFSHLLKWAPRNCPTLILKHNINWSVQIYILNSQVCPISADT